MSPKSKKLSLNRQLDVLGLSKGDWYYEKAPEKAEETSIRAAIDREHTDHPAKGVRQMREFLVTLGYAIGAKRVRRIMRRMGKARATEGKAKPA